MVGCGDGSAAPDWRKPIFPEGIYMKSLVSQGMAAYGIDQNDCLWEWGDLKVKKIDSMGEKLWEKANPNAEERRSTPKKIVWFQNHNKTPVKAASGNSWAMIQARDNESGALELYGWCESAKDGRFGSNTKDVYGEKFVLVGSEINHNDV